MRICFLTPKYASRSPSGGIANYTRDSARALAELGHDVSVVCVSREADAGQELDGGAEVHYVRPKRLPVRRAIRLLSRLPWMGGLSEAYHGWGLVEDSLGGWVKTWQLARPQPFDLIHAPDFGGIAFWGLLSPLARTPVLLRGHGFLDLEQPHLRWRGARFHHGLERFCLRRADYTLANSNHLAHIYLRRFGLRPERVGALTTGFRVAAVQHDPGALKRERGWPEDSFVVLFVGRVEYQKGCDLLFEALTHCHQQMPHLRAVLLGQLTESFTQASRSFMQRSSHWAWHPGPVPPREVARWMAEADLLALPSRSETFGRVVAEAQLRGLPAVATRVGALPEIIQDGVTGRLIAPDDALALARAILEMAASQEIRKTIGRRAQERALSRFDFGAVIEQQIRVYRAVAARRSPAPFLERTDERALAG